MGKGKNSGVGASSGGSGGGTQIGVNASLTGSNGPAGNQIGVNASVTNATGGGQGTQNTQNTQNTQGGKPTINATAMTTKEFMDGYNAQNPNRAQKSASYDYTDARPTSTGYSPSQNMNYKLDTGQRLTAKEQRMLDGMEQMQQPLAHDTTLYRGAHKNVLESLGIQNYDTLSPSQLKQALVGKEWTTKSLSSTSYDYNSSPFLSGPLAGGREVIMNISAAKGTKVTRVNPSQAEVVVARNTNWRIVDAKFTGGTANPRATYRPGGWPVVQLDIEVW